MSEEDSLTVEPLNRLVFTELYLRISNNGTLPHSQAQQLFRLLKENGYVLDEEDVE